MSGRIDRGLLGMLGAAVFASGLLVSVADAKERYEAAGARVEVTFEAQSGKLKSKKTRTGADGTFRLAELPVESLIESPEGK